MITYQEAFDATNPADTEEQRDVSARAILAGLAANEAYWNSRSELEALRARVEGHGVVARGSDEPEGPSTVVGMETEQAAAAIEGTATEEPMTALDAASVASASAASGAGTSAPVSDQSTIAALRKQLQDAGIQPEG